MNIIQDLFSWIITLFVIAPLQTELDQQLQNGSAPVTVVQDIRTCVEHGTMALANRAAGDPWWGINTTIHVMIGLTNAQDVLASASPECAKAFETAQQFLDNGEV